MRNEPHPPRTDAHRPLPKASWCITRYGLAGGSEAQSSPKTVSGTIFWSDSLAQLTEWRDAKPLPRAQTGEGTLKMQSNAGQAREDSGLPTDPYLSMARTLAATHHIIFTQLLSVAKIIYLACRALQMWKMVVLGGRASITRAGACSTAFHDMSIQ